MNGKRLSRIVALERITTQTSDADVLAWGATVTDNELRQTSGDRTGNELRAMTDADLYRQVRQAIEQLRERAAT